MRAGDDMPRGEPRAPRARRPGRGRILLVILAIGLFVLVTTLRSIASFYTDYLWFQSIGQTGVWRGVLGTKLTLAFVFIAIFFALLWFNLFIADRIAPKFRPAGPEEELIERYHEFVGRRTGLVRIAVSLLFAVIAGAGASGQWQEWLLFRNYVPFNIQDPQFHKDVGFYVFQLPFLSFLVGWIFAAFVIVFIVSAVAHYLNGGIRVQTPFQRVTPQVKAHLSVLLAMLALVKAAGYYLQQYSLSVSTRGTVDGPTYTDVHTQLPAIKLLLVISLFSVALFLYNIFRRGWVLPVARRRLVGLRRGGGRDDRARAGAEVPRRAVGVVEGAAVHRAQHRGHAIRDEARHRHADRLQERQQPQSRSRCSPTRIRSTTSACGTRPQPDRPDLPAAAGAEALLQDRRRRRRSLHDQRQHRRRSMLSARELDTANVPQQSWEGTHLTFTHGYGVVLSSASKQAPNGQPDLLVRDIPVHNETNIKLDQPGVYFGNHLDGYVVVNTKRQEIDYEDASGNNVPTAYTGKDGISVSSWFRRAAFALRFYDFNPLVSGNITGSSRILINRDIYSRVRAIAPFLSWDGDAYPAIVDGRIQWIVDGYTTTDRYPYAQRAITDGTGGLSGTFNYVRNSVKAVIDAYDGTITLYIVDHDDPIIRAYQKAFPHLFSTSDPSAEAARPLPLPRRPVPGADEHVGPLSPRQPRRVLHERQRVDRRARPGHGDADLGLVDVVRPRQQDHATGGQPGIAPYYQLLHLQDDNALRLRHPAALRSDERATTSR